MPLFDLDWKEILVLAALLALICWPPVVHSQTARCHYGHDGAYLLPDPVCTPGQANLCAKDFRTGPWRKVSESGG